MVEGDYDYYRVTRFDEEDLTVVTSTMGPHLNQFCERYKRLLRCPSVDMRDPTKWDKQYGLRSVATKREGYIVSLKTLQS